MEVREMYDKYSETVEKWKKKEEMQQIRSLFNRFNGIREMATTAAFDLHRSVQQSLMEFVIQYIKVQAEKPENMYDPRNEATVKLCKKLWPIIEEHGPGLPCI
jgi:predicted KAP-like P-loop ATPase